MARDHGGATTGLVPGRGMRAWSVRRCRHYGASVARKWSGLKLTSPIVLFENAGVLDQPFIPSVDELLKRLVTTRSNEDTFPLSYFDLFVHGLTNICRSIYYGMDLIINAVAFNLHAQGSEFGVGMGAAEDEFAFGFVSLRRPRTSSRNRRTYRQDGGVALREHVSRFPLRDR